MCIYNVNTHWPARHPFPHLWMALHPHSAARPLHAPRFPILLLHPNPGSLFFTQTRCLLQKCCPMH